jgi:hypothetical protein
MKHSLHISASFDKPDFLENLVEKLAERHIETGYGKVSMPRGWEALEISSTEAYVSGDVSLTYNTDKGNEDRINMPFITCFLFTCKKTNSEAYKIAWSTSLS